MGAFTKLFGNAILENVLVGTTASTAKFTIKGSGSTSATTSLLVQNSSTNVMSVTDDAAVNVYRLRAYVSTGTAPVNAYPIAAYTTGGGIASFEYGTAAGGAFLQFVRNGQSAGTIVSSGAELFDMIFAPGNSGSTLGIAIRPSNIGGVKIGGNNSTITHVNSAILNVESTTKGFLPPRMTSAQKIAIVSPAEGLMVYDTDLKRPCFHDGTNWITL